MTQRLAESLSIACIGAQSMNRNSNKSQKQVFTCVYFSDAERTKKFQIHNVYYKNFILKDFSFIPQQYEIFSLKIPITMLGFTMMEGIQANLYILLEIVKNLSKKLSEFIADENSFLKSIMIQN